MSDFNLFIYLTKIIVKKKQLFLFKIIIKIKIQKSRLEIPTTRWQGVFNLLKKKKFDLFEMSEAEINPHKQYCCIDKTILITAIYFSILLIIKADFHEILFPFNF